MLLAAEFVQAFHAETPRVVAPAIATLAYVNVDRRRIGIRVGSPLDGRRSVRPPHDRQGLVT